MHIYLIMNEFFLAHSGSNLLRRINHFDAIPGLVHALDNSDGNDLMHQRQKYIYFNRNLHHGRCSISAVNKSVNFVY